MNTADKDINSFAIIKMPRTFGDSYDLIIVVIHNDHGYCQELGSFRATPIKNISPDLTEIALDSNFLYWADCLRGFNNIEILFQSTRLDLVYFEYVKMIYKAAG